jgi:hypothetical protein
VRVLRVIYGAQPFESFRKIIDAALLTTKTAGR